MKYEIRANFEKKVEAGRVVTAITWETEVESMDKAAEKAASYISITEKEDGTTCGWMMIREAIDA